MTSTKIGGIKLVICPKYTQIPNLIKICPRNWDLEHDRTFHKPLLWAETSEQICLRKT